MFQNSTGPLSKTELLLFISSLSLDILKKLYMFDLEAVTTSPVITDGTVLVYLTTEGRKNWKKDLRKVCFGETGLCTVYSGFINPLCSSLVLPALTCTPSIASGFWRSTRRAGKSVGAR